VVTHQPAQRPYIQALQTLTMDNTPIVVAIYEEVGAVQRDSLAVERRLPFRVRGRKLLRPPAASLELRHVEADIAGPVKANALCVDAQQPVIMKHIGAKNTLQPPEGRIETVARLLILQMAPKQPSQVLTGVIGVAVEQQITQEVLASLPLEPGNGITIVLDRQRAEQLDLDGAHDRSFLAPP
jgi:hypothetical protein